MIVSSIVALLLNNALQLFQIILMFGAGTGSIFILRWFWWRINAWSEIAAMICSGVVSILFEFTPIGSMIFSEDFIQPYFKFPMVVLITTFVWVVVTFMTKPDDDETLVNLSLGKKLFFDAYYAGAYAFIFQSFFSLLCICIYACICSYAEIHAYIDEMHNFIRAW